MYYLKCYTCGHPNEVKGEYMVFCSACNKKLDNNFMDWHKKHPEKTLEDFKRLICISENELVITPVKKKNKSLKYWIGFAISFAIIYAIGHFGGEAIIRFIKSEKTSKDILTNEWVKETYGNYGLSVETPVKLTKGDLPIPENVKDLIEQMDVYNYMSAKGFKILINSIEYNPAIGQANLQGAANGSVNEMKMEKGVSNFDYTEEYLYKNEIPGFIQRGSYKQNGIDVEFINAGFSQGVIFWQVLTAYQKNDEVGRIAANKVIESIELNINKNNL